jgi:hypothetical protein
MADFRLPNETQRLAVLGRTGSGKSQLGVWALSMSPFDRQPYTVIDWKGEQLIADSDRIREIKLGEVPKQPGLYVVRPLPGDEDKLEAWLWKLWSAERQGLYIDEGYSISPRSPALQAILTQGRSKRLPVIALSQRPSWISRFILSEADFFAVFQLNDKNDRQRIQALTPKERMNVDERLEPYHCNWYDVGQDEVFKMKPVPDAQTILDRIDTRLSPKRKAM